MKSDILHSLNKFFLHPHTFFTVQREDSGLNHFFADVFCTFFIPCRIARHLGGSVVGLGWGSTKAASNPRPNLARTAACSGRFR